MANPDLTRRARKRDATRAEILETAREQMACEGAAALSLRAIARQMGLSAPALYRYFPDRDALVTALIVDAFNALAADLETAAHSPAETQAARLLALGNAYRTWALARPQDYLLIFGTPIPGYHAPAEFTAPAAKRGMDVLVEAVSAALDSGEFDPPPSYTRPSRTLQLQLSAWKTKSGYRARTHALHLALNAWTRMHGLVSFELTGALQPFFGDITEIYRDELRQLLLSAGLKTD
jgi:AcrR family transcriptional regulator